MKKYFIVTFCLSMFYFSCNNTPKDTTNEKTFQQPVSKRFSEKDISNLKYVEYTLDVKTKKAIEDWIKYNDLKEIVQNVKKGDLSYFKDNNKAIKAFLTEFKKTIPNTVNTPSVMARTTALETKIYKLESVTNLQTTTKKELGSTIKEFLESVSNLNLQMNKKLEKDSQYIEKP